MGFWDLSVSVCVSVCVCVSLIEPQCEVRALEEFRVHDLGFRVQGVGGQLLLSSSVVDSVCKVDIA